MTNQLNFLHSDKYSQAIKVAKKFISKGNNRPLLTFVHHEKGGSIYATDSHRAIEVRGVHGFEQDYLVHPKTLEFATGKYPNIEDLIDKEDEETIITLDREQIRIWLQLHKSLNQVLRQSYKRLSHITLVLDEELHLKVEDENELTIKLPFQEYNQSSEVKKISYDVTIMRDSLEAHSLLDSHSVDIKINGKMRPILIDNNTDVRTLVMPISVAR